VDPNETLSRLLAIAKGVQRGEDTGVGYDAEACALEMSELVLALDKWLVHGGFLPRVWNTP
jgi:hypothetical protein